MDQDQIEYIIISPFAPRSFPQKFCGFSIAYGFFTVWTYPVLSPKDGFNLPPAFRRLFQFPGKPEGEVFLPFGIEGVCAFSDFNVPLDGNVCGPEQDQPFPAFAPAREVPFSPSDSWPVAVFQPSFGFHGVPSPCPSPKGFPNFGVNRVEGSLRADGGVIIRPSSDHRIEDLDQDGLLRCSVQFDDPLCLVQQAFDVLFGRSGYQFALILPEVLT